MARAPGTRRARPARSPAAHGRAEEQQRATSWLLIGVALALLAFAVLRSAWLSDDAYITFRTVDNALHGYGLRWNVIERVQTYTHPLWMLLLTAATFVTRDFYFTPLVLSIACSLLAAAIVTRGFGSRGIVAALAVLTLASSKAFVDYSTSGLETPLTYLTLSAFLALYFRPDPTPRVRNMLALLAGLAVLTRLDTLLLIGPALVHAVSRARRNERAPMAALGLAPVLVWEAFSLVYYGFLLPNTAYAKLATGTPRLELLAQGFHYFVNAWQVDPVTPLAIALGLVCAVLARRARDAAVALGVLAYLVYVAWIGGDFMSGRFFAAPLLAAVILAAQRAASSRGVVAALAGLVALGFLAPHPPLITGSHYGDPPSHALDAHGIADERQFYYPATGWLSATRRSTVPAHRYVRDAAIARRGPDVKVMDTMGMHGFYVGPGIHVIDMFGLCDPLLSRLPARRDMAWRPGHFRRVVPAGYVASVRAAHSGIADERLARFDDRMRLVIRGPLLGGARWRAIVAFHLGRYDALIDTHRYAFPSGADTSQVAD